MFKQLKWLIGIGLLLLWGSVITQAANPIGLSMYGGQGSVTVAGNPGTNWFVVPTEIALPIWNQALQAQIAPQDSVNYIACRSFIVPGATNVLTEYAATNSSVATTNTVGATTLWFSWPNGTNAFAPGQWIVIHHVYNYQQLNEHAVDEANQVSAMTGTLQVYQQSNNVGGLSFTNFFTNVDITVSYAIVNSVLSNDVVYAMSPVSALVVPTGGISTEETFGTGVGPVMVGARRTPTLFVLTPGVNIANTNYIDTISSTFLY